MRYLFLFIALAVSLLADAQTYSGRVLGEEERPVKDVSVILMGNGGKTAVSFVRTAADGRFVIAAKEDKQADCLLFSCVGYARDTIMLSVFRQGQTVRLRQQTTVIREVRVKSERIREHGDTLNYNVSSFRQKQDRSIADVISKMPGLYVNNDGTIEYQGRKINKFYIEGIDLMGNKYSQASENLSADKVKTVQVMQNHQPVKMLRNIDFSEQAALNIVLKEDAKNVWQGMADIAGGRQLQNGENDMLYDTRLVGMLFARKKQSISIYKNNNTGKDILEEINSKKIFEENAPTETGILRNVDIETPCLEEHRTRLNESHAVATNWLFKTGKDNDLRMQISGLADRSVSDAARETQYMNLESGATMSEDINARTYRRELGGELMYNVNSGKTYLKNTFSAYADFNHSNGMSTVDGKGVRQYVEPHKRYVADDFSMIRRLENNKTAAVDAYLSYNNLPGKLLTADSTYQQLNMRSVYWGASTYFMHKVAGLYIKYTAQTSGKLLWTDIINSMAEDKDKYMETDTRLTPSMNYRSSWLKMDASAGVHWVMRSLDGQTRSNFIVQPKVRFVVEPTARWEMRLSYAYSWMPQSFASVMQTPMFMDYITVMQGTGSLDNTAIHQLGGYVGYRNIVRGFFASVNTDYRYTNDNIIYSGEIHNSVYHNRATTLRAPSQRFSVYGRVAQSLRWWKLNFGITGLYSRNKYKSLINNKLSQCNVENTTFVADVFVQPLPWLSAECKSHYIHSMQTNEITDNHNNLNSFVHIIKTYVMPGAWRLECTNEIYHSSDKSVSSSFFCDFGISYKIKRIEVGIQLNNAFGRNSFSQQIVTAEYSRYLVSRLRPREALMRVVFGL